MFKEFHGAGDDAIQAKGRIVARIIEELAVHTYLENECMYPEVRKLLPDLEDDVLESYEEHHFADVLCAELFAMDADDETFRREDDGADRKRLRPCCSPQRSKFFALGKLSGRRSVFDQERRGNPTTTPFYAIRIRSW